MSNKLKPDQLMKMFNRLGGDKEKAAPMAILVMQEIGSRLMKDTDSLTNEVKMLSIATGTTTEVLVALCSFMNEDISNLTEHVASLTARVARLEGAEDVGGKV